MQIGLFFGSFNPIHIGHLAIANIIANDTDLDRVWFVVSPQNPFKKDQHLAHEFDRYDMVKLAIDDNQKLNVTDIEFNLPKPSYTVDTLTYAREKYPQHKFSLIMGADNLSHFHKWKNYEQILRHHKLFIYPRAGAVAPINSLKNHSQIIIVEAPLLTISATYIRKAFKDERSVKYLIPDSVIEYIRRKKIYL